MLEVMLKRALTQSLCRLPPEMLRRMTGGRVVIDGKTLDAQVQLLISMANRLAAPHVHQVPVDKARANFRAEMKIIDVSSREMERVEPRYILGPSGVIPLRVYKPRRLASPAPIIVYYHGGGWVIGDLDSHDHICRLMADEVGAILIAVDYRLAPEHQFPAAYHDGYAAFRWACEAAQALGGRPENIAVAGDSAGGNLAAVVSYRAREEKVQLPRLQVLIYPSTDTTGAMPSRQTFAGGYFLEKQSLDWFKAQYLPDSVDIRDPRVSPLFAESHAGLPQAIVITAGYDPLRDEGEAYVKAMQAAGVEVHYQCAVGLVHGFWSMAASFKRQSV